MRIQILFEVIVLPAPLDNHSTRSVHIYLDKHVTEYPRGPPHKKIATSLLL